MSDIICPFCQEGDFDLPGLKAHYELGWCDAYNSTELIHSPFATPGPVTNAATQGCVGCDEATV